MKGSLTWSLMWCIFCAVLSHLLTNCVINYSTGWKLPTRRRWGHDSRPPRPCEVSSPLEMSSSPDTWWQNPSSSWAKTEWSLFMTNSRFNFNYLFVLEWPLELLQQGLDGVELGLGEGAAEARHDREVPGARLTLAAEHEPSLQPLLTLAPGHWGVVEAVTVSDLLPG